MASFFNNLGGRFGRQASRPAHSPTSQQSPSPGESSITSLNAPSLPHHPSSPSFTSEMSFDNQNDTTSPRLPQSRKPPFFFREENTALIAKGNFLTLAAKPEHVELGEWFAHQIVEQYRLLEGFVKIILEPDQKTGLPCCNPNTCPTMSAGDHIYTWLDQNKQAIKIPASQYISLVQKWIMGKINDPKLFPIEQANNGAQSGTAPPGSNVPIAAPPTNLNAPLSQLSGREWAGKSSGFPEDFHNNVVSLYRQMFRCYAHIYYGHWLEPLYHVGSTNHLNTCFLHFVNVGRLFNLLTEKDLKPMQPLVDIWVAKGHIAANPEEAQANAEAQAQAASSSQGLAKPSSSSSK